MTASDTVVLRHRSALLFLFVCLLIGPRPATAQSVESVVENMRSRYQQQLETVDTYIVETNLYTSYHRKVMKNGEPTYESQTRLKGAGSSQVASNTTPSAAYGVQFDRLIQHATYAGTETVNGVRSHVLQVDDPAKVNPNMTQGDAESMTYYIDAEEYVPTRFLVKPKGQSSRPSEASKITINMRDYRTTDGLTLPYRMEFQMDLNMSEEQKQKLAKVMKQMENMPEQQRKQMEKMMGDQMEMMKRMMSGEPMIVEVQRVDVNTELPSDVF